MVGDPKKKEGNDEEEEEAASSEEDLNLVREDMTDSQFRIASGDF